MNDTQKFIINCVSAIKEMDENFLRNPRAMQLLKDVAGSKLCFLDSEENIHYIGDFIEDNGVMYSNANYKPRYTYPTKGTYWDKGYSKYYDSYCNGYDYDDYDYDYGYGTKYLSSNLMLEGQDEPLDQEVFDILYKELDPLAIGTMVEFDGKTYDVGTYNKFYTDSFWNLYAVDKEKRIIGLIARDVEVY